MASEAIYAIQDYDCVAVVISSLDGLPGSQVRFQGFAGLGGKDRSSKGDFSSKLVAHELKWMVPWTWGFKRLWVLVLTEMLMLFFVILVVTGY